MKKIKHSFNKYGTIIYRSVMFSLLISLFFFLLYRLSVHPDTSPLFWGEVITIEVLFGSILSILFFLLFFAFYHFVCLVVDVIKRIFKRINAPKA